MKYFIECIDDEIFLSNDISEKVLNSAITNGKSLLDPLIRLHNFEPYYNSEQKLINHAWDSFEEYSNNYKRKSKTIYNKQVEFVKIIAERKIRSLQ